MVFEIYLTSAFEARNERASKEECPFDGAVWDEGYHIWTVKLDTLRDLTTLMRDAEWDVVIHGPSVDIPFYAIEIYDTWRE